MSIATLKSASGYVLVAAALASAGCAQMGPAIQGVALVEPIPTTHRWAADMLDDGRIAVGYYDTQRDIKVKLDEQLIFDSSTEYEASALSGLTLTAEGQDVWWAFRPKEPQREVVVRSSTGFKASIDDKTLPLPRVSLFPDAQGGVSAFWTGEQGLGMRWGEFGVGLARFNAQGELLDQKNALPGELPNVYSMADGGRFLITNHNYAAGGDVSAWIQASDGTTRTELVASQVKAVQPTGGWVSGSNLLAYWNNETGRLQGEFKLEMAWSDGAGKWQRSQLDWDVKDYPNVVRVAGSKGHAVLMAVLTSRANEAGSRDERLKVFASTDGGVNWSDVGPLRAEEFEYAKQAGMAVHELGDGNFMVIWTDWRYLRPSLRYSVFAKDTLEPIVMDAAFAGQAVAELADADVQTSVFEHEGQVIVVAERPDDAFAKQELVRLERSVDSLYSPKQEVVEPDYARLVERVNGLGRAYVEQRFADAYEYFDPFYRARVSLKEFLETQGRIQYKEYVHAETGTKFGVGANVLTRIVASVPKFVDNTGAAFESEEKEMENIGRWFWIDGEWYREFYSAALELRYTRH